MRKLKLDIESLHVDSFETLAGRRANGGTVNAHGDTDPIDLPTTQQTWPAPEPEPFSDWNTPPGTDYSNYSCFSCKGTCLKYECDGHVDQMQQEWG